MKSADLIGEWVVCNEDSAYNKQDSILLTQDINYQVYTSTSCCNHIAWNIVSANKIRIEKLYTCTEPMRISWVSKRDFIKLKKRHKAQLIIIKRNGKKVESFRLISFKIIQVDRYPYEIKEMVLKRIYE